MSICLSGSCRRSAILSPLNCPAILSPSRNEGEHHVLLDEHLAPEKLVRCIVEGLDATHGEILLARRQCHRNRRSGGPSCRVTLSFLALKLKGWDLPAVVNKPTEIVLSWKGDEPDWSPQEARND